VSRHVERQLSSSSPNLTEVHGVHARDGTEDASYLFFMLLIDLERARRPISVNAAYLKLSQNHSEVNRLYVPIVNAIEEESKKEHPGTIDLRAIAKDILPPIPDPIVAAPAPSPSATVPAVPKSTPAPPSPVAPPATVPTVPTVPAPSPPSGPTFIFTPPAPPARRPPPPPASVTTIPAPAPSSPPRRAYQREEVERQQRYLVHDAIRRRRRRARMAATCTHCGRPATHVSLPHELGKCQDHVY